MVMYYIYWAFYMVMLTIVVIMAYNWEKVKEKDSIAKYIAFLLVTFYLFCGPFYCLFQTSHDIVQARNYKVYQQEVITPVQEQYNNATLPDGYYYLGCEIVDIKKEIIEGEEMFAYTFGVIDCEGRNDAYIYSTNQLLNPEVPYLLVMDSLSTSNTTDDIIDVVWSCIE